MAVLDQLASSDTEVGDYARSQMDAPPLPLETPQDTQVRQQRESLQKDKIQRIRGRDFAAQGVATYQTPQGDVAPITDETGTPLRTKRVSRAWTALGEPRDVTMQNGSPVLSDPYATAPTKTAKTGEVYAITPGLPKKLVGVDTDVQAAQQQADRDKAVAQAAVAMRGKLSLDQHAELTATHDFKNAQKEFTGLANRTGLTGTSHEQTISDAVDSLDGPTGHAALDDHFNDLYGSDQANATKGLFSHDLSPQAEGYRSQLDQDKAKAHRTLDRLLTSKARAQGAQARQQASAEAAQTLQEQVVNTRLTNSGLNIPGLDGDPTQAQAQSSEVGHAAQGEPASGPPSVLPVETPASESLAQPGAEAQTAGVSAPGQGDEARRISAHKSQWRVWQEQATNDARAAGLPDVQSQPGESDSRLRLIDAIKRTETAGYHVPHFIGLPNEPEGDRPPTMDQESLVRALHQQEQDALKAGQSNKAAAVAKERGYWENGIRTGGMTAQQWKQQTGEDDPKYPESQPHAQGILGTIGRELTSKLAPAIGTALGGSAGALAGGAAGIETGPGAIATGLAGDIAGGAAGGALVDKLQRSVMGTQWSDENERQLEANRKEHPMAAQLGSMVPFLISLIGGGGAVKQLGKSIGPLGERIVASAAGGARAGLSEGTQEGVVEGKDVNPLDTMTRDALAFGAAGLFPPAKSLLMAATGKAVTDAAAMTLAGTLYDHVVHGKPLDLTATAQEIGADVPGFALQNAILGLLHGPLAARKGGPPPSAEPAPVEPTPSEPNAGAVPREDSSAQEPVPQQAAPAPLSADEPTTQQEPSPVQPEAEVSQQAGEAAAQGEPPAPDETAGATPRLTIPGLDAKEQSREHRAEMETAQRQDYAEQASEQNARENAAQMREQEGIAAQPEVPAGTTNLGQAFERATAKAPGSDDKTPAPSRAARRAKTKASPAPEVPGLASIEPSEAGATGLEPAGSKTESPTAETQSRKAASPERTTRGKGATAKTETTEEPSATPVPSNPEQKASASTERATDRSSETRPELATEDTEGKDTSSRPSKQPKEDSRQQKSQSQESISPDETRKSPQTPPDSKSKSPGTDEAFSSPEPASETPSVKPQKPGEILHSASKLKVIAEGSKAEPAADMPTVTVPKGTSHVRATNAKGQVATASITELRDNSSALQGGGPYTKVEPLRMVRGKLEPVEGKVRIESPKAEAPQPKAPNAPQEISTRPSGERERPGVSPREDVSKDRPEVRETDRQSSGGSGGPERPAAGEEVARESRDEETQAAKPLGEQAIRKLLKASHGLDPENIRFTNNPKSAREAAIDIANRQIEVNTAKIRSADQLDRVVREELLHAWSEGRVDGKSNAGLAKELLGSLTDAERKQVDAAIERGGYEQAHIPFEQTAKGLQKLADSWRSREWFQKLAGHILSWAHSAGFPISRLAAERIAARAVVDATREMNKGPKGAFGESRLSTAGVLRKGEPQPRGPPGEQVRESRVSDELKKIASDIKRKTPGLEVMGEAKRGLQSLLLPSAQTPEHLRAAETLASKLGPMNQRAESAMDRTKGPWKNFEKLGVQREDFPLDKNAGVQFMSAASTGREMPEEMKAYAALRDAEYAKRVKLLEEADAPIESVRDNYFPGIWTNESRRAFNLAMDEARKEGVLPEGTGVNDATDAQKAWVKARVDKLLEGGEGSDKDALAYLTRRPLKGKESFRKQKVFDDDIKNAFDFGLRPTSYNPVDLDRLKWSEMDRNIMANQAIKEWKDKGQMKVIKPGEPVPAGWQKIDDRYGTVWGPPDMAGQGAYIGRPVLGYRIVPDAVGDILNNYLSSSLYNNRYFGKPYTLWMGFANALNQTQLGVGSAFHAGFTTGEVQTSAGANLIKDVFGFALGNRTSKDLLNSTKNLFTATVETAFTGDKVLNAWRERGGTIDPRIAKVVRAVELAGGGFTMERGLQTDQTPRMVSDWHNGRKIRAAMRSPVAAIELLAKPLMHGLVPRQKAGVFAHLAWRIIEQNPDKTMEELTPEFRQAWNRVDSRLGQVRYDRLFTHNVAKNVVQGLVRAPGWTGGTIAELGGALKDTYKFFGQWAKEGKLPQDIPDRVAYTMSLLLTVGLTNAALTYAFTGEQPKDLDWLAFRTGNTDEHGSPERFVLPTYMKDLLAYAKEPVTTLVNKAHPAWSLFGDMIRNKDYYGVEIRHPDDSAAKQVLDTGKYVAKAFEPFWIRGARKEQEREAGPLRKALPFIGVMPAPKKMVQSPAERLADEFTKASLPVGGRTQVQADASNARYKLVEQIRRKEQPDYQAAMQAGYIKPKDIPALQARAQLTPLQYQVKKLPLDKAEAVYQKANPSEQQQLIAIIRSKRANQHNIFSPGASPSSPALASASRPSAFARL